MIWVLLFPFIFVLGFALVMLPVTLFVNLVILPRVLRRNAKAIRQGLEDQE